MALDNFIPVVWSARLMRYLDKRLVYAQEMCVNRDYEGEIKSLGDSVKINQIGPVTVGDYTKNSNIGDPETLNDAQTNMIIDQAKYFNFQIDDIDKAQQNPKLMDKAMERAAYAIADTIDLHVASRMKDNVATANKLGSTGSPKTDLGTAGKAYEYLVDLGVLLDEANVPTEGRWCNVPPWFHGLLLKDDRFVKAGTPRTDEVLRNGHVGEAAGFAIQKSNNVPSATSTTVFHILAGVNWACSFANQTTTLEAYRPEKRFADAAKGLHVYGSKVVMPSALAVLIANRP